MLSGVMINSVEDAVAVISKILESAKHEIVFVTSPSLLSIAGSYHTVEQAKQFTLNSGIMRGVTAITHANVEEARVRMDIGLDLRHSDQFHELSLFVADQQNSISGINTGVDEYTLDTPVSGFWSEDPAFATFLLTSFENAWGLAMPAKERIRELLKQG